MSNAIEVEGLTKIYDQGQRGVKSVVAVDRVSFQVQPGEIFGFLGPNGAGKTTTIRMLTGLTHPTSGRAGILGFDLFQDVTRIKKQICVVPERSILTKLSLNRAPFNLSKVQLGIAVIKVQSDKFQQRKSCYKVQHIYTVNRVKTILQVT